MSRNNIKIILGLLLALSIILPVNVMSPMFSTNDLDNVQGSVDSIPVIESKTIKNDDCMYKVWVGGELHYTKIYYQMSKDEGSRWSDAKTITDETYTPVSVQFLENKKTLHLIWEDGTQRGFTTYYMKSSDDGATWSKPMNAGFKNPKMVLDNNIIYVLSTTSDR
ncbi:MAG: exo-alpha-sialidase, partial [Candidatus Thermoplasmatota archaeon]|nr:exo-alpha-sialidase [Candidatus Thermoplasmatota archaeon]